MCRVISRFRLLYLSTKHEQIPKEGFQGFVPQGNNRRLLHHSSSSFFHPKVQYQSVPGTMYLRDPTCFASLLFKHRSTLETRPFNKKVGKGTTKTVYASRVHTTVTTVGTAPKNKKGSQLRTYHSVPQCQDRLSIKMNTQAVQTFPYRVVQGLPRLHAKTYLLPPGLDALDDASTRALRRALRVPDPSCISAAGSRSPASPATGRLRRLFRRGGGKVNHLYRDIGRGPSLACSVLHRKRRSQIDRAA